jgi:HSP20 family protein
MQTRDTRTWMWARACEMLTQADRLQQQFFRLGVSAAGTARDTARWEPPIDIVEDEEQLYLCVALPGVPPERIGVDIERVDQERYQLVVSAERPNLPTRRRGSTIHRLEIPYGRFERRITLAAGRYELLEQSFQNGCLELRLAKR